MNREEYNILFHKVGLNRVAFKMVNDCDEEILALVNEAIAAEREACAKVCESDPGPIYVWTDVKQRFAAAIRSRREQ